MIQYEEYCSLYGLNPFRGSTSDAGIKTKNRIAATCSKLLKEMNYDDIRIADIVEACGIRRQTFYNHFSNKRAVFAWIYNRLRANTSNRAGFDMDWERATYAKLEVMRLNREFFVALLSSCDGYYFMHLDQELAFQNYIEKIVRISKKMPTNRELAILRIYCIGVSHTTAEWVIGGCEQPIDKVVDIGYHAMPSFVRAVFFDDGAQAND